MNRSDLADRIAARLTTVVAPLAGATATSIAAAELARGLVRLTTNARDPRVVSTDTLDVGSVRVALAVVAEHFVALAAELEAEPLADFAACVPAAADVPA